MSTALSRLKSSFGKAEQRRTADEQQSNLIREPSQGTVYSTMNIRNPSDDKPSYQSIVQLKALLWKSWIIRRVHFISTFFEVFCPFLFMFLIAYAFSSLTTPESSQSRGNDTLDPIYYENPSWTITNDFETDFALLNNFSVYYSPDEALPKQLMAPFLNSNSTGFNVTALHCENDIDGKLEVIQDKGQTGLTAGIAFNLKEDGNKKPVLEYKIKILSGPGPIQTALLKYPIKTDQAPYNKGTAESFYKIFTKYQYYINREYIKHMCSLNQKNDCDDYFKPVSVYRMVYPRYRNPKISGLSFYDFLGTIITYSYVVFCPLLVKRITDEKSTKARELLRLIGMSDLMYWISHFLNNFIVVFAQIIGITIVMFVFYSPLITFSSPFIVFLGLLLFGIQTILFSMTITTVFNKPVIATIVTTVSWVMLNSIITSTLVPAFLPDKTQPASALNFVRRLSCLTPLGSSVFFLIQVGEFENYGRGLTFLNMSDFSTTYESFNVLQIFLIMLASIPIYCFLIWYLDNVWPFQDGVPKSPFYFLMPSYWFPDRKDTIDDNDEEDEEIKNSPIHEKIADGQTAVINVKNVTKKFYSGIGESKIAVDNLNLKIYSNQITVLLGHNGAGKSTTMNMITGMFSPSSGKVTVNGFNVSTQTKSARQSLSLCPQENIIFTELTVYEHLKLFALLKGSPQDKIHTEIDEVLNLLKLYDKIDAKAVNLSGGMKRKLSLGIALIGQTNTLILDEPTSGMDPDARRVIWDLLLSIRRERTILITTHYMEEADVLADRIAIMNVGRLSCTGSPFFLKSALGTGYRLQIDKMPNFNSEIFLKTIQKYIPDAKLSSDVETEIVFSLESSLSKNELMKRFMSLFEEIENNKEKLCVKSSSLSYSTLEDVFLSLGSDLEWNGLNEDCIENERLELSRAVELDQVSQSQLVFTQIFALLLKRFHYSRRYILMFVFQIVIPALVILLAVYIQNAMISTITGRTTASLSLGTKEIYGKDTKTFLFGNNKIKSHFEDLISYRECGVFYKVNESSNIRAISDDILLDVNDNLMNYVKHYLYGFGVEKDHYKVFVNYEQYHSPPLAFNVLFESILRTILDTDQVSDFQVTNNPILTSDDRKSFNILAFILPWIFTGLIFLPIAFPFLASSYIMFAIEENVSKAKLIQLMTKLSPITFWAANFIFDLLCHSIAIFILFMIIFGFDTEGVIFGKDSNNTGGTLFVLMFVFGVSIIPVAYILSFYFEKPSSGFVFMVIILFLFGFLSNLVMSILDFLNNFLGFTILDGGLDYIINVLRVIPIFSFLFGYQKVYKLTSFGKICKLFNSDYLDYIVCPNLANNADAQLNVLKGCCEKICDPCYSNFQPFAFTEFGAGFEILFMILIGLLCFTLIILYEVFKVPILSRLNKMMALKTPYNDGQVDGNSIGLIETEDQDVEIERARIEQQVDRNSIQDIFTVHHLRKKFGNFTAVSDLTFGVHHGECFGLLGVNGAGKTTTFSMLTGDLIATTGNAFIDEGKYSLVDDLKEFQSRIGYCPQFDALLPLITGEETLYLFARLRGIPAQNIERDVKNLIKMVGLEKHAKKKAGAYSGGNKRKLSIAIALIGNPVVLFLDEPSAGVDPAARRKIWQTLGYLKRNFNCSIILTSHSMEECEALCNRLGIMVNGRFRCLGTTLHLRNRYGEGYSVTISLKKDKKFDEEYMRIIEAEMMKYIPSARLKDFHQGLLQFHIIDKNEKWSNIFRQMVTINQKLDFEDYHVSDTTLEQIFLQFARHQKADFRLYLNNK